MIIKEKSQLEHEKIELENKVKASVNRIESQQKELLQIEDDFNEFRQRVLYYEKALEKVNLNLNQKSFKNFLFESKIF